MSREPENKISSWIKKLEQESWQLELLVSAFTIFLLLQAIGEYTQFLTGLNYEYDLSDSLLTFLYVFLALLGLAIKALTIFLIIHLLLRGFWIGVIGLRSVQENINFDKLKYSSFFTQVLNKKVISLDRMVIKLDEICSLLFSFAFLIISMIISFGLHLIVLGGLAIFFKSLTNLTSGILSTIIGVIGSISVFFVFISGLIYFIDYVSLGFFKKFKVISKIYYPIYQFIGTITLAIISKSLYYYFISRFSKKKIRIIYFVIALLILFVSLTKFDQYPFFPGNENLKTLYNNQYDDLRDAKSYIASVSIQSKIVSGKFLELFIRYDPRDNEKIQTNCPEFTTLKKSGLNWSKTLEASDGGFLLTSQNYKDEDLDRLINCLASFYEVKINGLLIRDIEYYYYRHPAKNQKGLICMIDLSNFASGKNILEVKKVFLDTNGTKKKNDYTQVPFWIE